VCCLFILGHNVLCAGPALAQTLKVWGPTGEASWFSSGNWSPLGAPGSGNNAEISNGGTANATSGSTNVAANRIEVGKNGGSGGMTVGGTNRNVTLESDFDIGETGNAFATGPVTVTSNGTVTINNSTNLRVGNAGAGDIDLGSTGTGTGATATGMGMLTIENTTLVDVFDDLDVGQASAALDSTANATATLVMNSVSTVDIGGDFDIGQSGGAGRAVAVGTATVGNVTNLIVGMSFVAGRTTGSIHANGNSGSGTASITDVPNFDVGFGSALMPGNFDVADAIVSGTERATSVGNVTLTRVTLDVKRRINLGELNGGSTNPATTTDATLSLVNSLVTTEDLDIATVVGGTAGTAKGKLSLNPSLVNVTGVMTLGAGSEMVFALAGTTRATGGTGSGQYSAMNVGTAVLGGKLTVQLAGGFTPVSGNQFQIISATSTTGMFNPAGITLPPLSGLAWNVTTNNSGVLLTVGAPLQGDFNGNGVVDAADYVVWRNTGGTPAAYNLWRANFGKTMGSGSVMSQPVPEASTLALVGMLLSMTLAGRTTRRRAAR
jgi:hypothetical protein